MRYSEIKRVTNETKIEVGLNLDDYAKLRIDSGSGFFNHMLELFAAHGRFGLTVVCDGDVEVDFHHSVEDIGIVLGEAFKKALGDKGGITRYADITLPMDEALVLCAVDISGRSFLRYEVKPNATKLTDDGIETAPTVGLFDAELIEEFFQAFVRSSGVTLHIVQLFGKNTHHIFEAVFKAFGRAMRKAVAVDKSLANEIPSTKGVL